MLQTLLQRIAIELMPELPTEDHTVNEYNIDVLNGLLPSGSGINSGMTVDWERSHRAEIRLIGSYMYDDRLYFGFVATVTPSLIYGYDIDIEVVSCDDEEQSLEELQSEYSDYLFSTISMSLDEKYQFTWCAGDISVVSDTSPEDEFHTFTVISSDNETGVIYLDEVSAQSPVDAAGVVVQQREDRGCHLVDVVVTAGAVSALPADPQQFASATPMQSLTVVYYDAEEGQIVVEHVETSRSDKAISAAARLRELPVEALVDPFVLPGHVYPVDADNHAIPEVDADD